MTERKMIERPIACDTSRLYADLPSAISYLIGIQRQYPTATLEEHWTGYEDMEMRFVYFSPETDEELERRLEAERVKQRQAEEEKRREEQRKKDLAEFNRLKSKLGIRG